MAEIETWEGLVWVDYVTFLQTCHKCHVLRMVEAAIGCLETYPVPHAAAQNTVLGLERKVLGQRGILERAVSGNKTHF